MWGSKQNSSFSGDQSTTLISKSAVINGDMTVAGDLEIEGVVRGNISVADNAKVLVRIADGGRVEGELRAPRVVVNGHLKGDLYASDHVELAAKAHVEGDVHYQLIEMMKGAQVNGQLLYAGAEATVPAAAKSKETNKPVDGDEGLPAGA